MKNIFNKILNHFTGKATAAAKKEFKSATKRKKPSGAPSFSWMKTEGVLKQRMNRDEALKIFNFEPNVKVSQEKLNEVSL